MENDRLFEVRKAFKKYFNNSEYAELPKELKVGIEYDELDIPDLGHCWQVDYELFFEDNEYYLVFSADHHMTNYRREKIFENGEIETLETWF